MKIKKIGTRKKVYLVSTYKSLGNVAVKALNITTPSKNFADSFLFLFSKMNTRNIHVAAAEKTVRIGKVCK